MSQEQSLRMVAELVDKSSGPLKQIREQFKNFGQTVEHLRPLKAGLEGIDKAAVATGRTITSGLNPALATIGVTSLTVVGSLAAVGAAIRNFGSSASALGTLARETGVAAQELRVLQGVAGKFGIEAESLGGTITKFADNMRMARDGIGPIMEFLQRNGKTAEGRRYFQGLAADLRNSKDNTDALMKALEGLEHIQDPAGRRAYAAEVLGNADLGKLGDQHLGPLRKLMEEQRKALGPLDPKTIKSAEEYEQAMKGLQGTMAKLGTAIATEAMPHVSELMKRLNEWVKDARNGVTPALVGTAREIAEGLKGIKWEEMFREASKGAAEIKPLLSELRGFLTDLGKPNTGTGISTAMKEFRETARETKSAADSISNVVKAIQAFKGGSWLEGFRRLDGAEGPLARKAAPLPGDDKLEREEEVGRLRGQIDEFKKRGGSLEGLIGKRTAEGNAPEAERLKKALDTNSQRLGELEKRLKEILGGGDAKVQQQSFEGGGGPGGNIHLAAARAGAAVRAWGGGHGGGGGIPGYGGGGGFPGYGGGFGGEGGPGGAPGGSPGVRERLPRRGEFTPRPGGAAEGARRLREGSEGGGDAPRGNGRGDARAARTSQMMAYAMDQLRREGVPESQLRQAAAHLVGQAQMESGLDPNKVHDHGTGYGIYGARDPKGWGDYKGARRSQMVKWLKANGYAVNSAEGQMRYMAHEAMTGGYKNTRRILMGQGTGDVEADTNAITKEFEAPYRINRRSPAVREAMRVGPEAQSTGRADARPSGPGVQPDGRYFDGTYFYRGSPGKWRRDDLADGAPDWRAGRLKPGEKGGAEGQDLGDGFKGGGWKPGWGGNGEQPGGAVRAAMRGRTPEMLTDPKDERRESFYDFYNRRRGKARDGRFTGRREDFPQPNANPDNPRQADLREFLKEEPDEFGFKGGLEDTFSRHRMEVQGAVPPEYQPKRPLSLDEIRKFRAPGLPEDGGRGALDRASKSSVMGGPGAAPPPVNGSLHVQVMEPGPNTRVKTNVGGTLFRDIKQSRGVRMAQSDEGQDV